MSPYYCCSSLEINEEHHITGEKSPRIRVMGVFSLTWVTYVTPPNPRPGDCHGKCWRKNMIEHCTYKLRVDMDNAQDLHRTILCTNLLWKWERFMRPYPSVRGYWQLKCWQKEEVASISVVWLLRNCLCSYKYFPTMWMQATLTKFQLSQREDTEVERVLLSKRSVSVRRRRRQKRAIGSKSNWN